MRVRNFFLVPLLILSLTTSNFFVPKAQAGGVGFATEFTQILNNIQLLDQSLTLATQLETEFQQLEQAIINTINIPNQIFSPIQADLSRIAQVVNTGEGLAYGMANLDEQFKLQYPKFAAAGGTPFPQQYKTWSDATMSTITNTLKGVGLTAQQLTDEQQVLDALKQMSTSNSGALQAAQTGNQIAVEMVSQLQKLRALMLDDITAKDAYFALQAQKDSYDNSIMDQTFQPIQVVGTGKKY